MTPLLLIIEIDSASDCYCMVVVDEFVVVDVVMAASTSGNDVWSVLLAAYLFCWSLVFSSFWAHEFVTCKIMFK